MVLLIRGIAPPSQFLAGFKFRIGCLNLPSQGLKSGRRCYITPAVSGVPKQMGTKSELAAQTLPSGGPTSGRKCYVNRAFSVIPNEGDKSKALKKQKEQKEKNFPRTP